MAGLRGEAVSRALGSPALALRNAGGLGTLTLLLLLDMIFKPGA